MSKVIWTPTVDEPEVKPVVDEEPTQALVYAAQCLAQAYDDDEEIYLTRLRKVRTNGPHAYQWAITLDRDMYHHQRTVDREGVVGELEVYT